MQTSLNPNRKLAKELIERAENEAEAMVELVKDATQLAADPLSDNDAKQIAEKLRDAADAFLKMLGLVAP